MTRHTRSWTYSARDVEIPLCHILPLRSFYLDMVGFFVVLTAHTKLSTVTDNHSIQFCLLYWELIPNCSFFLILISSLLFIRQYRPFSLCRIIPTTKVYSTRLALSELYVCCKSLAIFCIQGQKLDRVYYWLLVCMYTSTWKLNIIQLDLDSSWTPPASKTH